MSYELKLFRRDRIEAAMRDGWCPVNGEVSASETHVLMRKWLVNEKCEKGVDNGTVTH